MDNTPDMLDFVKAASDANRLRIIGLLAQRPATIKEIVQELDLPFRQAFNHLAHLEYVGVVHRSEDYFILDEGAVESLSRKQFSSRRPAYIPAPDLDSKSRKVLAAHLNADGRAQSDRRDRGNAGSRLITHGESSPPGLQSSPGRRSGSRRRCSIQRRKAWAR